MKRLVVLSFIATSVGISAQSIGNSPYASFGIGDIKYDNSIEISSMGGISTANIADFNNTFNFRNPAANANFDLTSIKLQGTNENNFYRSDYNNMNAKKHSTYLSGISLALPLTKKIKAGIGYQPFSSKTYNIVTTENLANSVVRANAFKGDGSINTLHTALSYQISPSFALGARANYFFGNIVDLEEIAFSNAELVNGFKTTKKVKAFNFTLGTAYLKKLKNDQRFTFGATYTLGATGTMDTQYTNSTYYYRGSEKLYENIIEAKSDSNKNLIPSEASIGFGFGKDLKNFNSIQLDFRNGEKVLIFGKDFELQDSYRFSYGGWYLPNYNNFRNYFSRVIYRYGAFYEKGNLKINNTNINSYGLSFGVSLPFQNSSIARMSSLDLGLELGKRGTIENNLISQKFINLKVGINFADKWFQKRIYD